MEISLFWFRWEPQNKRCRISFVCLAAKLIDLNHQRNVEYLHPRRWNQLSSFHWGNVGSFYLFERLFFLQSFFQSWIISRRNFLSEHFAFLLEFFSSLSISRFSMVKLFLMVLDNFIFPWTFTMSRVLNL